MQTHKKRAEQFGSLFKCFAFVDNQALRLKLNFSRTLTNGLLIVFGVSCICTKCERKVTPRRVTKAPFCHNFCDAPHDAANDNVDSGAPRLAEISSRLSFCDKKEL